MAKTSIAKTGNWNVRIKATVTKVVYVEGCTEQEANDDPFGYAVDEHEVGQEDYEVLSVENAD